MALSDRLILGRRAAYLCCACDYAAVWQRSLIEGNRDCAKEYRRKALAYLWAYTVVRDYPISTETGACCSDCEDDDFVLAVINKMDPGCVKCGCGTRPLTCDIGYKYTVAAGVDAQFQQDADPAIPYLILTDLNSWSGTWAQHVGQIATDEVFVTPYAGEVIFNAANNDYFVALPDGTVGNLFPIVDAARVGQAVTFTSRNPSVNAYMGREVIIELSVDATNWEAVYVGPESALSSPYLVSNTGSDQWIYVRITYIYGDIGQCRETVNGYLDASAPPYPTYSIGFHPVDFNALVSPLPTDTWLFQPFRESKMVISWNWKISTFTPGVFYIPFTYGGADGTSLFFFQAVSFLGNTEFGLMVSVNGGAYVREFVFPGVYNIITNGGWHHVALVRNSAQAGVWSIPDLVMYVDDIAYDAQVVPSTATGLSYPDNIDAPYAPAPNDLSSPSTVYIGDTFVFVSDMRINNFYIGLYAPSAAEVAAICRPAAYEGNDGGWQRQLWLRARNPDSANASPWLNPWAPGPNWFGWQGAANIEAIQEVPPWVV